MVPNTSPFRDAEPTVPIRPHRRRHSHLFSQGLLATVIVWLASEARALTNPLPPPRMESIEVSIERTSEPEVLHARFDGEFTYWVAYSDFPTTMAFPVPPQTEILGVWQFEAPLTWFPIPDRYTTILPEMPTIPMIQWQVLPVTPGYDVTFRVAYEHDLIRRSDECVYYYALGSGRYQIDHPLYDELLSIFDIRIPVGFDVRHVRLDNDPIPFSFTPPNLWIYFFSSEPVTRDLIVILAPIQSDLANLWVIR